MEPAQVMSSAQSLKLCLRSTFIDIESDSEIEEQPTIGRSLSDNGGADLKRRQFSDFFQEETEYVKALEGKVEKWYEERRLRNRSESNADLDSSCLPQSEELGSASSGASSETDEQEVPPPPEPWEPSPALGCNPGSMGHPNLCQRPCRFFAEGLCESGDACGFCHIPHKRGSLDKKNREVLQSIPNAERCSLLASVLKEKAQLRPGSLTAAVDAWAWECCGVQAANDVLELREYVASTSSLKRLVGCLEAMSFYGLCSVSRGFVEGPRVKKATGRLLEQLKGSIH